MTPAEISAPSLDISAVVTSLGVFSLAVAAVVGGIYKGIREIKKGGSDKSAELKNSFVIENLATINGLSDSLRLLIETSGEIRDLLRQNIRREENLVEALRDSREMIRSQIEEQHRLRAATVDLVEQIRRMG